jgi:hypothetical protein
MRGDNGVLAGAQPERAREDAVMLAPWLVILSTLALEGILWSLALVAQGGILVGSILHMAVISLLAAWVRRLARGGQDLRIPLLLLATTAAIGPIGPAGVLLTIGLRRWVGIRVQAVRSPQER